MGIERVGQVYYRVHDMDRAVAFYEQALGLKLKFRDGERWAAFDGGGTTLGLEGGAAQAAGEVGAHPSGGAVVALRASGLDEIVERLVSGGHVPPDQSITTGGHERRVELADPSGNRLVLYEPLQAAS